MEEITHIIDIYDRDEIELRSPSGGKLMDLEVKRSFCGVTAPNKQFIPKLSNVKPNNVCIDCLKLIVQEVHSLRISSHGTLDRQRQD